MRVIIESPSDTDHHISHDEYNITDSYKSAIVTVHVIYTVNYHAVRLLMLRCTCKKCWPNHNSPTVLLLTTFMFITTNELHIIKLKLRTDAHAHKNWTPTLAGKRRLGTNNALHETSGLFDVSIVQAQCTDFA